MTSPKSKKPKNTKPAPTKQQNTQIKNSVSDDSPIIQSLRERVQKQAGIISEQKKQLVSSARKQVTQIQKHKGQIKALTLKQKTRLAENKKYSQLKIDFIKAETSLKLAEKNEIHSNQIDSLELSRNRTLEDVKKSHVEKLKASNAAGRERLQNQAKLHSEKVAKLRQEQKATIKKLKKSNSEKITELMQSSEQQTHQANKDIARLRQEISAFKDTDKDKTIKQLNNSRKILHDKAAEIKTLEQQLLTVQNFAGSQNNKASSAFSLERFVLKLLSVGYHQYARIHYLDLITESDWQGLLALFQSQANGFDTLETMRPLFLPWIQNYHALIDVIHDRGYTIRPMEDYSENKGQDKSLYMYHDVHAWDILPALGMALANKDRGIGTTFLLNIDQARIDLSHEAGYRIFGTLAGKNVHPGLHCNPFATWVRMDVFKGDDKAFMSWVKSETSAGELKSLITTNQYVSGAFAKSTKRTAKAGTLEQLNKCFQKLQSFVPQAVSASHHGDIINSLYRPDDFKYTPDSIFTDTLALLRDKAVKPIGIKISPTAIQENSSGTIDIYSEMPNKASYYENLHECLATGKNMLLINHPGAISNSGLTMNLDFVSHLKNSKYKNYQPVSAPLQNPSQMRTGNDYIFEDED